MPRGFSWIDERYARDLLRRVMAPSASVERPIVPDAPPPRSRPVPKDATLPRFQPPEAPLLERIEALCAWAHQETGAERTFLADEYGLMVAGEGEPSAPDVALAAPLMRVASEAASVREGEEVPAWGALHLGGSGLLLWFVAEGPHGRFALGLVREEPLSKAWMRRLHEALAQTLTEA